MRFPAVIPVALAAVLSAAAPVFAQDWAPMISKEDGFRANFPGQPKVEAITYTTEFNLKLPGRVYRAADPLGRYSTTVVDYRDVERMHSERAAACRASRARTRRTATAARTTSPEVAGATDPPCRILKRDGVKVTTTALLPRGRLRPAAAPDQSDQSAPTWPCTSTRTSLHETTVPAGMPEPILFMESLAWVNDQGLAIRYRTLYTEGTATSSSRIPSRRSRSGSRDLHRSAAKPAR
jgi:hypothetical protein